MSRINAVVSFKRSVEDGANITEVVVDEGDGDTATVPFFQPIGEDSQPLPGDELVTVESSGSGAEVAVAGADIKNAGKAGKGEKRLYARDASGAVVAEVWLHSDGTVSLDQNPDDAAAVASLVLDELNAVKAELTTLKGAIAAGLTAVGVALAANGPAGATAFNSALGPFPHSPSSVASTTVLLKKP